MRKKGGTHGQRRAPPLVQSSSILPPPPSLGALGALGGPREEPEEMGWSGGGRGRPIHSYHLQVGYFVVSDFLLYLMKRRP